MRRARRSLFSGSRVLAAAAVAALLGAAPLQSADAQTQKLRMLMPEPHGHTFRMFYIGAEKGWFREEGIELEYLPIPGGAINLVPQLAQGTGDIAFAGGYTVIQARARGVDVVGINSASTESLWALIAHKNSNIRRAQDLKGKTVGVVSFSSATHFMALGLLRAGGLTDKDVALKPVGMGGPAAISQGQLDAYVWFKTQAVALQTRGAPVEMIDLDPLIPLPQDLTLVMREVATKRASQMRAFTKVFWRAVLYDHDPANHAENDQYQAKYAPETVADKAYLKAIRAFEKARHDRDVAKGWKLGSTQPERLTAAQNFLVELKVIEKATPVELMYDNSYLPK